MRRFPAGMLHGLSEQVRKNIVSQVYVGIVQSVVQENTDDMSYAFVPYVSVDELEGADAQAVARPVFQQVRIGKQQSPSCPWSAAALTIASRAEGCHGRQLIRTCLTV